MSQGRTLGKVLPARAARMLALGCLLAALGCASSRRAAFDATAGTYDRATLRYDIDAARLGTPMVAARVQAQQVSYESIPTSPVAGQCVGTLLVEYPHEEAAPGMARATVEIKAAPPTLAGEESSATRLWRRVRQATTTGGETHEKWVLDIPRTQMDQIIGRLNEGGYFHDQPAVADGIDLSVEVADARTSKTWNQMPELDALVSRVRGEGQLVEYTRPAGAPKLGTLDNLLAARSRDERRSGSQWPVMGDRAAPQIARVAPPATMPVATLAPPALPALPAPAPQAGGVQTVSYSVPVARPVVAAQPEIIPLPPVGSMTAPPAIVPANVPTEAPLGPLGAAPVAHQPPSNLARLPSPPANLWR